MAEGMRKVACHSKYVQYAPKVLSSVCICYNCITPGYHSAHPHHPQTKTFCLGGDIVDCTTERKSLDSRQWKRKDQTKNLVESMLRRLQAVIDSSMAMATSPSTSLSSCTTMGPFQGQNHINKRFINLFLMDWPGLLVHTVKLRCTVYSKRHSWASLLLKVTSVKR